MEGPNAPTREPAGSGARPATAGAARRPRRLRRAVAIFLCFALAIILFVCYIGVFGGNVHAIQPGRAYRSATLTGFSYNSLSARLFGNDLDSVIRRDHIGTVVCLRSGSASDDWYREELAISRRDGADHRDIPFSARAMPSPGTLVKLLDTFDHARYPILLHCQAGADRTGLASTLYATLYEHEPLDRAESEELTWRYGHFPVGRTRAMDDFFSLYRRDANGMDLRTWILTRYPKLFRQQSGAAPE